MKKKLWLVFSLAFLASCGSSQQNQDSNGADSTSNEQSQVENIQKFGLDQNISEQEVEDVYNQLPASLKNKSLKSIAFESKFRNVYFKHKQRANWEDSDVSENLTFLPLKDGGWQVIFEAQECWEDCSPKYQTFKYKDGKLTKDSKKNLPEITLEEIVDDPFLAYNNYDIQNMLKSDNEYSFASYNYQNDTLFVWSEITGHSGEISEYLNSSYGPYLWDGEKFVSIANKSKENTDDQSWPLIFDDCLGGIKLGSEIPEEVVDFVYKSEGNNLFSYSRGGKKYFELHADKNGFIDMIEVFHPKYKGNFQKIGEVIQDNKDAIILKENGKYLITLKGYFNTAIQMVTDKEKGGICKSIRILAEEPKIISEDENVGKMYEQIVVKYSAFDNSESDWDWRENGMITENRISRYADECFSFICLEWLGQRYGVIEYQTSFQGEDDPEGTYNSGVSVFTYDEKGELQETEIDKQYLVEKAYLREYQSLEPEFRLEPSGEILVTASGQNPIKLLLIGGKYRKPTED